MNEIKLSVSDENMQTLLNILENLKVGLITKITTDKDSTKSRNISQYKAKVNTIVLEENSGTSDKSGKYINPAAYKRRLNSK